MNVEEKSGDMQESERIKKCLLNNSHDGVCNVWNELKKVCCIIDTECVGNVKFEDGNICS